MQFMQNYMDEYTIINTLDILYKIKNNNYK